MSLQKKGFPLQKIRRLVSSQKSGQISLMTGIFCVAFVAVFLFAALQLERYAAAAFYLEDALAASNLASALIDPEKYGVSHRIIIGNAKDAYERYKWAVKENLNLDDEWEAENGRIIQGQVQIVSYVIYNVLGETVEVYTFDENGEMNRYEEVAEQVCAPNGILIENTSIYSEISFDVEVVPGVRVRARKSNLADIIG